MFSPKNAMCFILWNLYPIGYVNDDKCKAVNPISFFSNVDLELYLHDGKTS